MKLFDNCSFGAIAAATADLSGGEGELEVRALCLRQAKLCRRLAKFDLVGIVEILAGLFMHPGNHCATPRIGGLIHLVVLRGRGMQKPTHLVIREWLNGILLSDAFGVDEYPVEDVFGAVAPSRSGRATLPEGS